MSAPVLAQPVARMLPSQANIIRIVNGDRSLPTLSLAARDWFFRALLIAIGLRMAGVKGRKLVVASTGGAAAIDGFIVIHTLWHNKGVELPKEMGSLF